MAEGGAGGSEIDRGTEIAQNRGEPVGSILRDAVEEERRKSKRAGAQETLAQEGPVEYAGSRHWRRLRERRRRREIGRGCGDCAPMPVGSTAAPRDALWSMMHHELLPFPICCLSQRHGSVICRRYHATV
jgi:hypothetical protein